MGRMAGRAVNSKAKVLSRNALVKEEVVRYTTDGAISANAEEHAYLYNQSAGNYYQVKTGEMVEVIAAGNLPQTNQDSIRFTDDDGKQWNKFMTETSFPRNELPFNQMHNFERQMMSWGYQSFLTAPDGYAYTWKLAQGDKIKPLVKAGSSAVSAATPLGIVIRRYLQGANVESAYGGHYDGGLQSNRWYYNDPQTLSSTTASTETQAWTLSLLKSEAYKFFTGGIYAPTNLLTAKIYIDYPLTLYNQYYVAPTYNNLPYNNTYGVAPDHTLTASENIYFEKMSRFTPTISVTNLNNKSLDVYVKDSGSTASNVRVRMVGVKMLK